MNSKTLILVIILSVLIGIVIFLLTSFPFGGKASLLNVSVSNSNATVSPTPEPTLPPLTPDSNLSEELNKITPPDFEEEFENLRGSLN